MIRIQITENSLWVRVGKLDKDRVWVKVEKLGFLSSILLASLYETQTWRLPLGVEPRDETEAERLTQPNDRFTLAIWVFILTFKGV